MIPPVTIDSLNAEWKKDAIIDDTELSRELIRIPVLHSKYVHILTYHDMMLKKLRGDYYRTKHTRSEYLKGNLNNEEDLKKHGLEPMRKKVLRQDIEEFLLADPEVDKINSKIAYQEGIVKLCELILKELHSRTFQLRSAIDWNRFIAGG